MRADPDMRERESVCVCVREREFVRVCERESLLRERERETDSLSLTHTHTLTPCNTDRCSPSRSRRSQGWMHGASGLPPRGRVGVLRSRATAVVKLLGSNKIRTGAAPVCPMRLAACRHTAISREGEGGGVAE